MAQYKVLIPGSPELVVDELGLRNLAISKRIQAGTPVVDVASGQTYQAKLVPGVFSSREWLVALLLSIFLGQLGVDSFYLGKTGQGIGKLLTFGGCGIWWLIDVILIATRAANDAENRPLS
ncbi:MAG: hypothetical protein RLZZ06_214 [Actinomycetota bacterium]|jgi:TM2 domain-containing membrane protein YozV